MKHSRFPDELIMMLLSYYRRHTQPRGQHLGRSKDMLLLFVFASLP